jgi:oligopeptidase A
MMTTSGSTTSSKAAPSEGDRLREISERLATLSDRFAANLREAEGVWRKRVVDERQLAGMTAVAKEAARAKAMDEGCEGFLLTLETTSYRAVMHHADDRALRHELYEAYSTRASDRGPFAGRFDNGLLIDEMLELRHEQAGMKGFGNYADASLQGSTGESAEQIERFLLELKSKLRQSAQAELDDIWRLTKSRDNLKGFRPWDLPYYAARLKEQHPHRCIAQVASSEPAPALAMLRELELALFDLRVHRDYVPAGRSSKLRSHVLDTFAQVRREVSLLPPPPWDRSACGFVDAFGNARGAGYFVRLRGS